MQQVISDISTDKFASNIAVGGPGGDVFCFLGRTEHNVRNITFFRTDGVIRCLTCFKYDGTSISVGQRVCDSNPATFSFHSDEQVRTVYLYSNSINGGRFAGIKVVTDRQECEAYAGNYTPRAEDQVEVAVGTGKWNGIFGRSAVDIDSFGVAILKY